MNTLKTIDEAIENLGYLRNGKFGSEEAVNEMLEETEANLKALRDKLGSEELVEGMEAQDILNRCTNLNDYIYREDPEYYGDYYVTLSEELHRLKEILILGKQKKPACSIDSMPSIILTYADAHKAKQAIEKKQ